MEPDRAAMSNSASAAIEFDFNPLAAGGQLQAHLKQAIGADAGRRRFHCGFAHGQTALPWPRRRRQSSTGLSRHERSLNQVLF